MGKFLEIAKTILIQERRPLRVTEIIELAREKGYLHFSGGKTPDQTVKARISDDIRKKRELSDFKRVGKGIFAVRDFNQNEYAAKPHIKTIRQDEYVLVVRTIDVYRIGQFDGIKKDKYKRIIEFLLNRNNTFFMPRIQAEKDIEHKQILSYILVEKDNQILRFVRGVYTNAHSMLRGSYCIGFGGHVQQEDFNLFAMADQDNGYLNSVTRELLEELRIPESFIRQQRLRTVGVLNDDFSEVGKSHIAIIQKVNLDSFPIQNIRKLKGEKSINQLSLIPITELGKDFEKYEYWSKLCIKSFYKSSITLGCKIHKVNNFSLSKHRRVIIVVGAIGSGKTEASKILLQDFGYEVVSSGRELQELMNAQPISVIGRSSFQDLAYKFITSNGGFESLAEKMINIVSANPTGRFVIDGIRNIRTYEIIKSKLGSSCALIFVESTPDNCYKFYSNREGRKLSQLKFYEYLNHPVEQDIKTILGKANVVIYNHGSLNSYHSKIKKYFKNELR